MSKIIGAIAGFFKKDQNVSRNGSYTERQSSKKGVIFDTLIQFFEEDDWDIAQIEAKSVLTINYTGKNSRWLCVAIVKELQEQFIFYSVVPAEVPQKKQLAILKLLTKINYELAVGNFEMDFTDNSICCKTSIDVEGDRITTALIRQVVNPNLEIMDIYLPEIMATIRGGISQEILDSIMSDVIGKIPVTNDLIYEYFPVFVEITQEATPLQPKLLPDSQVCLDTSSVVVPHKVEPFSVTNVRVAFECPRLFYLGYRFGGMTMFLPSGNSLGIGKSFHQLSEQFIKLAQQDSHFQSLLEPEPSQIQVEAIAAQMQQLFYGQIFFPHLQEASKHDPGKAPALLRLWQGLTGLIRRWAELMLKNRSYCAAAEVLSKTFIAQELSVKHYFSLANGTKQLVQGRFDSLVYDFEQHRLCVVEYKTYQSVDPSAQLAQVALYSYMLREKVGLPINSAVYCVLPDLQELTFSWEQLENTVHQLIPQKLQQMQQWLNWSQFNPDPPPPTAQPHLCRICPQQTKCQTFFTATNSQSNASHQQSSAQSQTAIEAHEGTLRLILPEPTADVTLGNTTPIDANALGEKLVTALRHFGVATEYQAAIIGPAFIRVKLKPSLGVKVGAIMKLSDDLRVQLGLEFRPLIAPQSGYVSVDLPRPDRQIARFEQYVQRELSPCLGPIKMAIGVNMNGNLVEADLSDSNTCHFLVGGTSGSGKSEFLRSLVLSLLVRHSAKTLQIVLIDPKRVTFPDFEQLPWLYTPVIKDDTEAIDLMVQLVQEMQQRYQQFEQAGCIDINTYNQKMNSKNGQLLPRIVCIFDEYADFMNEKEICKALEQSIKRLGAMARAAGIHLIIATQRPEAKVVTPLIKSNLPGRVALRTASEADSKIILGETYTDAAYLLGKGDLLYQSGASLLRLQSLLVMDIKLPKYS